MFLQKGTAPYFRPGQGLHIAIVDCSSIIGSHFLQAAQENSRIDSITCFTSRTFQLISLCSKVNKVVTYTASPLKLSWANHIRNECTHIDAIVLLFDPVVASYSGVNEPSRYDEGHERAHPSSISNEAIGAMDVVSEVGISGMRKSWAPVYQMTRAAYDQGARVCVWATAKPDSLTHSRDWEFLNGSCFTDVVMMCTGDIVNDGQYVQNRWNLYQNYIIPRLHFNCVLRRVFGTVTLSDVAEAGVHLLLTSDAVLGRRTNLSSVRSYSASDLSQLISSLATL